VSWENVLTACVGYERADGLWVSGCNTRKADRTPGEAGMHMRSLPEIPSPLKVAMMGLCRYDIPDEWKLYLEGQSSQ